MFNAVKQRILDTLQPWFQEPLGYLETGDKQQGVLVNSNFRCGYYIDRQAIYTILRDKYGIDTSFDASSYPAVKCNFYYNTELPPANQHYGTLEEADWGLTLSQIKESAKYVTITFSIFRTGCCLISGNCSDEVLTYIYKFVKQLLSDEYPNICFQVKRPKPKDKKVKRKTYTVSLSTAYRDSIMDS